MSEKFTKAVKNMRPWLADLLKQDPIILGEVRRFPTKPGVYLISDGEGHLYVGRCKDIRQRMRNHGGNSPASSTFAFRLACQAIGRVVSYKKGDGRKELMADEKFRGAFLRNVKNIRLMKVRYIVIEDDVSQHLFELYVHLALKTPHNSFATH